MPQLPQIRRDVLEKIFIDPSARRAYEALQEALATTPDDIVTLTNEVASARANAEAASNQAAVALQFARRETRAGFGLRGTPDAGGQTLDVVPEALVLALLPYMPQPPRPPAPLQPNDAQYILAARIFGG